MYAPCVSPHFDVIIDRDKLALFYRGQDAWELFDRQKDPQELHNLYGRKGYEEVADGLKTKLISLDDQYRDEEAAQILDEEK